MIKIQWNINNSTDKILSKYHMLLLVLRWYIYLCVKSYGENAQKNRCDIDKNVRKIEKWGIDCE